MLAQIQKKYLGAIVPIINVHGVIRPETTEWVVKQLAQVNTQRAVALAVSINSPGGLPVQSELITRKLKAFSHKNNLKLFTFGKDLAASGGYMVLSAGDEVYCDSTTIVGSIGVVLTKFNVKGLAEKASLSTRRITTDDKLLTHILSPFENLKEEQKKYIESLLKESHESFIQYVKAARGSKLKDDPRMFSGEVFLGNEAQQLGLIDHVGQMSSVISAKYPGAQLNLPSKSPFSLFG